MSNDNTQPQETAGTISQPAQTSTMTPVTPEATHSEAVISAVQGMNVGEYVETTDKAVAADVTSFWDTMKQDAKNIELKVENLVDGAIRFFKQEVSTVDKDISDAKEAVNTDIADAKNDVEKEETAVASDVKNEEGTITSDAASVETKVEGEISDVEADVKKI